MKENITDLYSKDVIKHWGIKGMKWGVRKAGTSSDSSSDDYKEYTSLKSKSFNELNKSELEKIRDYSNLEASYNKATEVKKAASKTEIAKKSVEKMVTDAVKAQAKKQIESVVTKAFDELATEVNNTFDEGTIPNTNQQNKNKK